MKKMLIASVVFLTLTNCSNDASDGNAATDTTNFNTVPNNSPAPLGDTARDVNNEGTRTNLNTRTDVDTAQKRQRDTAPKPGGSTQR